MCTVSLTKSTEGVYFLGGNRDEQKIRKPGLPPERKTAKNTAYLAPTDANAGGTWIAVNEHRVAFAILNRYQGNAPQPDLPENPPSRGGIIPSLIHLDHLENAKEEFSEIIEVSSFRPFALLGLDFKTREILRWDWDGAVLKIEDGFRPPQLWVSAGRNQEEIARFRMQVFRSAIENNAGSNIDIELIKSIHASDFPERGAYSISMELEHVQTVSSTIIECGNRIGMHHTIGLPTSESVWQDYWLD